MSSYNMLEKLSTRWQVPTGSGGEKELRVVMLIVCLLCLFVCVCVHVQETGMWGMISSRKEIVSEPRTGGKEGNVRNVFSSSRNASLSCSVFDEAMVTFYQEVAEAEVLSADGTANL